MYERHKICFGRLTEFSIRVCATYCGAVQGFAKYICSYTTSLYFNTGDKFQTYFTSQGVSIDGIIINSHHGEENKAPITVRPVQTVTRNR